jgi:hypothetical protein
LPKALDLDLIESDIKDPVLDVVNPVVVRIEAQGDLDKAWTFFVKNIPDLSLMAKWRLTQKKKLILDHLLDTEEESIFGVLERLERDIQPLVQSDGSMPSLERERRVGTVQALKNALSKLEVLPGVPTDEYENEVKRVAKRINETLQNLEAEAIADGGSVDDVDRDALINAAALTFGTPAQKPPTAAQLLAQREGQFLQAALAEGKLGEGVSDQAREAVLGAMKAAEQQFQVATLSGMEFDFDDIIARIVGELPSVPTEGALAARMAPMVPVSPEFTAGAGLPVAPSGLPVGFVVPEGISPQAFEGPVGRTAAFALQAQQNRAREEILSLELEAEVDDQSQARFTTTEDIPQWLVDEFISSGGLGGPDVTQPIAPTPQWLQPGGFPAGTPLKLVGDIVKKIDLTGVEPGKAIPGGGKLATVEEVEAHRASEVEQEAEEEAEQAAAEAAADAARLAAEAVVPEKTPAEIAEEEADVARRQRSAQRRARTQRIIT